ncbi:Poly(U)-binding-splicing factor puf60 [Podila horticola]|nr:Poly(U)-binding-splicing factor puf60 [Podila horticola]
MDENTSQGLKRSNDEIGTQDSVSNMESTTPDSNASKRSKADSFEIEHATEDDMATTGQELDNELKDPATGLTVSQATALERAKMFAKELQEELVRAGSLFSAAEPEPSLAITNIAEQQKAMHILCRVYVGSISFEATEDDVRRKLGRFGPIKELALKVDPMSGKHRGFCFVEYELPEAAIVAVQASDTVEVVGRHLKIGRPKNYDANAVNVIARATATAASTAQRLVAMQNGGAHDRESVASEENMSISGNQRYMVMQSLARSAGESGLFPSSGATVQAPGSIESTVVRLQYNATPADIDDQLEEEFSEECSKYGPVIRVHMMPLTDGVLRIFIQFGSPIEINDKHS